MFGAMFQNMPNVVKNLLIINLLFFLATFVLEKQGIRLVEILGLYYPDSELFKPYQIVTHFFMHSGIRHILLNMLGLVVFGSHLERYWGSKRFLLFYFITALGAALLHMVVVGFEVHAATGSFFPASDGIVGIDGDMIYSMQDITREQLSKAANVFVPTVGASGAIYGLVMAFAMLFPNTEFLLYFAIPVKAKWLAIMMGAFALYSGYQDSQGDSVAHFAHLGGMLFGFIMIQIWKRDKTKFY